MGDDNTKTADRDELFDLRSPLSIRKKKLQKKKINREYEDRIEEKTNHRTKNNEGTCNINVSVFLEDDKTKTADTDELFDLGRAESIRQRKLQKKKINREYEDRIAEDEEKSKKKPPMRPIRDVINRIRWDPQLPSQQFSLGYMDRFIGIVEADFKAFFRGGISNAGPDDLAVPEHCFRYVKYNGIIVWDRAARVDHVFGSAGLGWKIEQEMAIIDIGYRLDN